MTCFVLGLAFLVGSTQMAVAGTAVTLVNAKLMWSLFLGSTVKNLKTGSVDEQFDLLST